MNIELPKDRLATTDARGSRIWLYPSNVKGRFRNLRTLVSGLLLAVFLGLPWLKISGEQSILLDIPHRRFTFFGLTLWAHDAPLLLFALVGMGLSLAFITAVFGRLWCGWACPQTVFIDLIFRKIESFIEGDSVKRRSLDKAPWNGPKLPKLFEKLYKKAIKWLLYLAASLFITHVTLSYFVGTNTLIEMLHTPPSENPTSFLIMLIFTGLILFDFGWFREQFCTIACPYGRIQSVLMDDHSLAVVYDTKRGEPRRTAPDKPHADCINCYRCVQVCPTGIDIRRGVQLECIACTACIDACDDVMQRIGKPQGLIRYDSAHGLKTGKRASIYENLLIKRTWIYLGLLILTGGGLAYSIKHRPILDYVVMRAKDSAYQILGDDLSNHFKIDFSNQSENEVSISLEIGSQTTNDTNNIVLIFPAGPLTIPAGASKTADFFIKFPKAFLNGAGHGSLLIKIISKTKSKTKYEEQKEAGVHKIVIKKEVLNLVGPV